MARLTDRVDLSVQWWMSAGDTLWSLSWLNICPFLHGAWQWCIIHCESELPHVAFVCLPCCVLSRHLWMSRQCAKSNWKKRDFHFQIQRVTFGFFLGFGSSSKMWVKIQSNDTLCIWLDWFSVQSVYWLGDEEADCTMSLFLKYIFDGNKTFWNLLKLHFSDRQTVSVSFSQRQRKVHWSLSEGLDSQHVWMSEDGQSERLKLE